MMRRCPECTCRVPSEELAINEGVCGECRVALHYGEDMEGYC